jgi:hypothetical protein
LFYESYLYYGAVFQGHDEVTFGEPLLYTQERNMTMNSNLFFKNDSLFSKLHLASYSTNAVCNKAVNGHQFGSNSDCNWQISTVGNL